MRKRKGGSGGGLLPLAAAALLCMTCAVLLLCCRSPLKGETDRSGDRDGGVTYSDGESSLYITDLHLSTVAGVVLKNGSGAVPLMLADGEIVCMTPPDDTDLDNSVMKAFAYRMAHMPAERELGTAEDPEYLSDFGLSEPSASVSLILTDGETERVFLGDKAPFDGGYYAKKESSPEIYLIDDVTARMLRYSIDDFRKLEVLPSVPADVSLKDLTFFFLSRDGCDLTVTGSEENGAAVFKMTEPFEATPDWEKVAELVYSPLVSLNECTFITADSGEYKNYLSGEDGEENVTLQYTLRGETAILRFTDTGDGGWYVRRDGSSQLVRINGEDASFLNVQASDLVSGTVYSVSAADLSAIYIETENKDWSVHFSGTGDALCARCGETVLNQQQTVALTDAVTMLPQSGELTGTADLNGEALARLTFCLRSGEEDVVELIPVTDRYCAVVVNGSYGAVTYTSTVNELLREADALLKG